jgi:hypothetical protein
VCVCGSGEGVILSEFRAFREFEGLGYILFVCVCSGGRGVVVSEVSGMSEFIELSELGMWNTCRLCMCAVAGMAWYSANCANVVKVANSGSGLNVARVCFRWWEGRGIKRIERVDRIWGVGNTWRSCVFEYDF